MRPGVLVGSDDLIFTSLKRTFLKIRSEYMKHSPLYLLHLKTYTHMKDLIC